MSNEQCNEPAAPLIPRRGESFACVLPKGHDGPHRPGGTCFKHGAYVGEAGVPPRCPRESEGCIPDDVKAEIAAQPTPAAVEKIEARRDFEMTAEDVVDAAKAREHLTWWLNLTRRWRNTLNEDDPREMASTEDVSSAQFTAIRTILHENSTLLAENKRLVDLAADYDRFQRSTTKELKDRDEFLLKLQRDNAALQSRLASGEKENERLRAAYEGSGAGLLLKWERELPPDTPFVCPRCNGQGTVSTPPHIPGDARTFSTSSSTAYPCPVCRGSKLVTLSDAKQIPHPSPTGEP